MRRRTFLKSMGFAAAGSTMLGNLMRVAAVANATGIQAGDYKALVCVFLFGGNDGDNTIIPYGQTDYDAYARARSILAIPRAGLLPIPNSDTGGREWAFHPSWPEMQQLFLQQKLAVVANAGNLVAPITRDQYLRGSAPLPPQLFSHNDQQVQWQTSWPGEPSKTGWGGRMADAVAALNPESPISMSISLAGSNTYQIGNQVFPYSVSPEGAVSLWYYNEEWGNAETVVTKAILEKSYANLFEQTYGETFKRAIENSQRLNRILEGAPALKTLFSTESDLSRQLNMVARLISVRGALGARRQIFFVELDGFDTHGEQLVTHANLLRELSLGFKSFYDATVELGVANDVTSFTLSDFGRTYKSNGKGSDHGWGGHQFVMGGAVKGGRLYGEMPIHRIDGPNDTTDGRWIPTIAADEYAATLAQWFGVAGSDLSLVLPNIGRFNRANLGFL
jgi:uncharacterized protein (DUF1501 family)